MKYAEETYPQAIPVVDMEHFRQGVADREYSKWDVFFQRPRRNSKRENVWELFFEQPNDFGYTLKEISHSKHIILGDGENNKYANPHSEDCFSYAALEKNGWTGVFDRHIRLRSQLKKQFDREWDAMTAGKGKILGVKVRKTGYDRMKTQSVQPTDGELGAKIDEMRKAMGGARVFLATEDVTVEQGFRTKYGEDLMTFPKKWNCFPELDSNSFDAYNDPAATEQLHGKVATSQTEDTISYLREMYFLSKCDALAAGRSSGIIYILLQNRGKYEQTYIFDLGYYC